MSATSHTQLNRSIATYKVNANNELRFAAIVSFDFCQASSIQRVATLLRRTIAISMLLLLLLHWVAGRCGRLLLLTVHLLLVLGCVGMSTAGVDGRWWHWARRSALVRMRRTEIVALVSVLVRRRAAERLLWVVHGQGSGRSRGCGGGGGGRGRLLGGVGSETCGSGGGAV
jgi:hypothetical protein